MGIPFFYTHIIRKHGKILRNFINNNVKTHINNLYLDCNSIIYDCLREFSSVDEDKLIKATIARIDEIIELLAPTNKCFIAFDGVAPFSKLQQQRIRRFKSSFEKQAKKEMGIINEGCNWDTNTITPGTEFAARLSTQINEYFKEKDSMTKEEYIISACDEKGEGEHKIFSYIKNNEQYHSSTTTVVYGLDADLIMLALVNASVCKNLFLYRETPTYIESINPELSNTEHYLLDTGLLKNAINELLCDDNDNTDRIKDYIFLCFFLGNDFLPHTPSINIRNDGITLLINAYKKVIKSLPLVDNLNSKIPRLVSDDNKPVWFTLKSLVGELKTGEHERLKNEYIVRSRFNCKHTTVSPERFNLIPMIDRRIEEYINPCEYMWQSRYYGQLFGIYSGGDSRKKVCNQYIKSLEWTLSYYLDECLDWRWGYGYLYTPLLDDLYDYIPVLSSNFFTKPVNNPVSSNTQLAYVLPRSSYHLLNMRVLEIMNTKKYKEYHNDISIIWAFCKYFWESKLIFNNDVDINELENDIKLKILT